VKLLLEKGANIEAKNNNGNTALIWAAWNDKADVVKLLLEKGASIETTGQHGITALDAGRGYADVYRLLMTKQIPQEERDEMTKGMAAFKLAKRPEDFAEAQMHFQKAANLAYGLPDPWLKLALAEENLAYARGQQDNFVKAKEALEVYCYRVADPRDVQTGRQKIAQIEAKLKHYNDFVDEMEMGVNAYNKGPSGYNEAIQHWSKASKMYPDHPPLVDQAYYNLGEVYMELNDLDNAYMYMQKALELVPEPTSFDNLGRFIAQYNNMGVVLERRGDLQKACIYYKKGCDHGDKISCGNMDHCGRKTP